MKGKGIVLRIFCLILIASALPFSIAQATLPEEIPSCYHPLIGRLSEEGFDLDFLSRLFVDPRAEVRPEVMTISLVSRETRDLYSQFLSPESILLAKKFLAENLKILWEAERQFQVDKEIIVAILLVESRFGENIGRHRVLPTLASMALINSEDNLQNNYQVLREADPELSYQWLVGVAKRRADWAYRELKCFLRIIRDETMDPLEVKGSYAGALGMAQFLPSSYLTYSLNPKSFEEWLTSRERAMISIANYLKLNGWKKNLTVQKKKQVLWTYNHSEPYVETILQIALKIKPEAYRRSPQKKDKAPQK